MASIIHLAKDNADLVCRCNCANALIAFPELMGCPWFGSGWMFTCGECQGEFTFARGVQVDETWEALARRESAMKQQAEDDYPKPFKQHRLSNWEKKTLYNNAQKLANKMPSDQRRAFLDGFQQALDDEPEQLGYRGNTSARRVETMQELLADVKVGQRYVYLDGTIIPASLKAVHFDGWYARHDFDFVPQVEALKNPSLLKNVLANPAYWQINALKRE